MRRMTVVLLGVFLLATVLGAASPALAKDGRRWHRRDRFVERDYRRAQFAGYWRGYPVGYGRGYFDGYRYPRFIVLPQEVVAIYPEYVTVVRPVVYDDIVLLPRYRYRVIERHRDQFLLIFGTGNLTVVLRG